MEINRNIHFQNYDYKKVKCANNIILVLMVGNDVMEPESAYEDKLYFIFNSDGKPFEDEIFERFGFPHLIDLFPQETGG